MSIEPKLVSGWVTASWALLGTAAAAVAYGIAFALQPHGGDYLGASVLPVFMACVITCWEATLLGCLCSGVALVSERPPRRSIRWAFGANLAGCLAVSTFLLVMA